MAIEKTDEEKLAAMPRDDILALAESLHAVAKAQVVAGKKLSAEEQVIFDRATRELPRLRNTHH